MSEDDHVLQTDEAREPLTSITTALAAAIATPFPLNSKRLTGPYLRCIARAIDLPTRGTANETQVMIEGKLREMGCEPSNVQVLLVGDPHDKQTLSLRDVDGAFVDAGPLHETNDGGAGDDPEDRDETERAESSSEASSDHGGRLLMKSLLSSKSETRSSQLSPWS